MQISQIKYIQSPRSAEAFALLSREHDAPDFPLHVFRDVERAVRADREPARARGRGYGVLMDLVLGLVGALLGGFVFRLLGLYAYGLVGQLVIATAGAVMLIWLVRRLR